MEQKEEITRNEYIIKKLEQKIGGLEKEKLELEFAVLVLMNEKDQLTKKISEIQSSKKED